MKNLVERDEWKYKLDPNYRNEIDRQELEASRKILHKDAPTKEKRSCNRHEDCEEANRKWLERNPGNERWMIPVNFHCHDEDCEDCFGQ